MNRRIAILSLVVTLSLACAPIVLARTDTLGLPVEFRILDMKKSVNLGGVLLGGGRVIALKRLTVEITLLGTPFPVHTSPEMIADTKSFRQFAQQNAKEIDMEPAGRGTMAQAEGQPFFELGKVFDMFRKGSEIRGKGSIRGEKNGNSFEVTLESIREISVDGKVVFKDR